MLLCRFNLPGKWTLSNLQDLAPTQAQHGNVGTNSRCASCAAQLSFCCEGRQDCTPHTFAAAICAAVWPPAQPQEAGCLDSALTSPCAVCSIVKVFVDHVDPSLTWEFVRQMREFCSLPLLAKVTLPVCCASSARYGAYAPTLQPEGQSV